MKKQLLTSLYAVLVITALPMLSACESFDNWSEDMVRGNSKTSTVGKASPPATSTYVPTPKNYAAKKKPEYPTPENTSSVTAASAYPAAQTTPKPSAVAPVVEAPAVPYPVVEKMPAPALPATPKAVATISQQTSVPTPPPVPAYVPMAPTPAPMQVPAYVPPAPQVVPAVTPTPTPAPAIVAAPTPVPAPAAKPVVAEKPAPFVASSFDTQGDYTLGPGDQLRITVYGQEELTGQYKVDAKGLVSFPLIGKVEAAGRTTTQMEETITNGLNTGFIVDPRVSIEVMNYRPVYVLGEVREPGKFEYAPGMTILQAIASAGGYTYRADEDKVEITRSTGSAQEKLTVDQSEMVKPGDTIVVKRRWF